MQDYVWRNPCTNEVIASLEKGRFIYRPSKSACTGSLCTANRHLWDNTWTDVIALRDAKTLDSLIIFYVRIMGHYSLFVEMTKRTKADPKNRQCAEDLMTVMLSPQWFKILQDAILNSKKNWIPKEVPLFGYQCELRVTQQVEKSTKNTQVAHQVKKNTENIQKLARRISKQRKTPKSQAKKLNHKRT